MNKLRANAINSRVESLLQEHIRLRLDFNKVLVSIWEDDFYALWRKDMYAYSSTISGFKKAIMDGKLSNAMTIKRAWNKSNKVFNQIKQSHV